MSTHTEDVEELSYGPDNRMAKSSFVNKEQTHAAAN